MPKLKYRRPGLYRASELRMELERRLGIPVPKWRFYYWQRLGFIPRGAVSIGWWQAWTDLQAQNIAAALAHA